MWEHSLGRKLLVAGTGLSFLGVLFAFQLERHSYRMGKVDREFNSLAISFLPILALGLITTLIGSLFWSRQTETRTLAICGFFLTAVALVLIFVTPVNFHSWTISLGAVYVTAVFIGAFFLIRAAGRSIVSRFALSRKGKAS